MPRHFPDRDQFAGIVARCRAEGLRMVPIYRQLLSDTLTPVTAYLQLRRERYSFLFESVVGGERVGRYSFLGANPTLEIKAAGPKVTIRELTGPNPAVREFEAADPLAELETLLQEYRGPHIPGLPRFTGGLVGYAGYDTVRYVERLPNPPTDDRHLPDMSFALYDEMVVFDHINKTILVIAYLSLDQRSDDELYQAGCTKCDSLCRQLQKPGETLTALDLDLRLQPEADAFTANFDQPGFEAIVRKAQEYIHAGDIFQVVLSQRLKRRTNATPLAIYRALRVVNPSPFMFLLETPDVHLVGSSPEVLVRVDNRVTTIRPLAGTRKRGATEEEDQRLAEELLADEKERAEHVMLVDLARNDVGRVSQYGSVEISDVMMIERYSHVMHITSNVTGTLRPEKTTLDALRSGLPAGTVSGAPKVRAMEIIDELEPHRRGPYGGGVGYLDFTGDMDTCIALRTLVIQGDTVYLQAGAGIVADSNPASEYEETLNKARALIKAIRIAEEQLS